MMKTRGLLTAALALFAFACANQSKTVTNNSQPQPAASPAGTTDELAVARDKYQKHCAVCHGISGEGGTVKIEDKTLKVPALTKGHALTHTDEKLVKQVIDGGNGMPAFKDKLSTKEAADLVTYIRREFQKK